MDFAFSGEQEMMRDTLSRFLSRHYSFEARCDIVSGAAGWSASHWESLVAMGVVALPIPENAGGLGGAPSDLAAISEIFGRYLVVEPVLPSIILAGRALARAPQHPGAAEWLSRILAGQAHASFAHEETSGTCDIDDIACRIDIADNGYRLSGTKSLVLGAEDAGLLVVTARLPDQTHAMALVPAGAKGITRMPYRTIDGRPAANIAFDDVRLGDEALLLRDDGESVQDVVAGGIVALSAEATGAMDVLLEMSAGYAASRQQFGKPIISFQAIAHRLADMKLACIKARATLLYTVALADDGRAAPRDYSLLKAQIGRLGRAVGEAAVQVHGGIGMTDELPVGHYLKRLIAIEAMFGRTDDHLKAAGRSALIQEVHLSEARGCSVAGDVVMSR